jgi:hypothetical protein
MKSKWMAQFSSAARNVVVIGLAFALAASAGCSGGGKVAKVAGKVTASGKPVTGGTITFSPIAEGVTEPGRPASVEVQSDGSFETTNGAVIGKCQVTYVAPTVPLPEGYVARPSVQPPVSPFMGLFPKDKEVEVKSGDNTINIELVSFKK